MHVSDGMGCQFYALYLFLGLLLPSLSATFPVHFRFKYSLMPPEMVSSLSLSMHIQAFPFCYFQVSLVLASSGSGSRYFVVFRVCKRLLRNSGAFDLFGVHDSYSL
jgi:hypothetical protein